MVAVFLLVILLFVAMGIDLGYAYVTKANLSKAVDAAALRGMLNIAQGTTTAGNIAASVFAANYQTSGRDSTAPTPTVTWNPPTPTFGVQQQIQVTATTTINTFFARIVPSLQTLTVSDTAQSTRANVMMALVLDHSRSMTLNGGQQALPPAVTTFLSYFSDQLDQAAETGFGDSGSLDVTMRHPFTSDITSFVNGLIFTGGTYAQGGLDNAALALCGWAVPGTYPYTGTACPVVPNTTKVVVFFTDGWANSNYDVLNNQPGGGGCPSTPVYYGGCAWDEDQAGWCGTQNGQNTLYPPYIGVWDSNGNNVRGCAPSTFPSKAGNPTALDNPQDAETNVPNDAMYRAMTWANAMRAQGVLVYAVGLGDKISQPFLYQMANDPSGTAFEGFAYNSGTPQGLAEFAVDCPDQAGKPSCASELNQAFQTIATDILLKITQ
jgi:Flp pilus assembly protein TadG